MGKVVTVNGCTGPVDTFIVEPFVPHSEEFYLSIQVLRQQMCILVFCLQSMNSCRPVLLAMKNSLVLIPLLSNVVLV
jgi:hypothetical protein